MAGSEFYDHTTYPSQGAAGSSAAMRSELELVEAGFGKLPDLAGNGGKITAVNAGGTALEAITTTGTGSGVRATSPTLVTPVIGAANFTSVGAYAVTFTFTAITGVTFPTTGTLATLAGAETLTNKTLTSPAINAPTGITATNISNTPAGGVTESTVQGAIDGLEARKSSIQTNGFRLSLTTGLPVTTADVVGGTTIYAIPYKGNEIALNTGTAWVMHKSAEFSIALSGLVVGRPYDVFCFINASDVPELQVLAWASDTARATAIDYQDGVLKKSGTNTHRYMGTFYTTAANTTEDSAANRYLWNYYHRAARPMAKAGANATWTYSAAVWRQAQGLVANQLNYVVGVVEDGVSATVQTSSINDTATVRNVRVGLGYNSTTAPTGSQQLVSVENSRNVGLSNAAAAMPALGKNFVAWLELGGGADVQTFFGTSTGAIHGVVMA